VLSGLSVALIEAKLIPSPQQRGKPTHFTCYRGAFLREWGVDKILPQIATSDKFASQMPIIPVWWNSNQQI